MDARQAMGIGTAGFTAMMSVMALEEHGLQPSGRPVIVTGAAGGVGSVAGAILAPPGYDVVAPTGPAPAPPPLPEPRAREILQPQAPSAPPPPPPHTQPRGRPT